MPGGGGNGYGWCVVFFSLWLCLRKKKWDPTSVQTTCSTLHTDIYLSLGCALWYQTGVSFSVHIINTFNFFSTCKTEYVYKTNYIIVLTIIRESSVKTKWDWWKFNIFSCAFPHHTEFFFQWPAGGWFFVFFSVLFWNEKWCFYCCCGREIEIKCEIASDSDFDLCYVHLKQWLTTISSEFFNVSWESMAMAPSCMCATAAITCWKKKRSQCIQRSLPIRHDDSSIFSNSSIGDVKMRKIQINPKIDYIQSIRIITSIKFMCCTHLNCQIQRIDFQFCTVLVCYVSAATAADFVQIIEEKKALPVYFFLT